MTEPGKPFGLACHCGFTADQPEVFIDHCLTTKHIELPEGVSDGAGLAEFIEIFGLIQRISAQEAAGEVVELPEGMEIRPVTEADILDDDDLPDEVKQELLRRMDAAQQHAKREDN